MKKKRIVENDKSKILDTIEELDQKKNEALKIAWQKVELLLLAWLYLKILTFFTNIGLQHKSDV